MCRIPFTSKNLFSAPVQMREDLNETSAPVLKTPRVCSVVEAAASGYWPMVVGRTFQGFGAALFLGGGLQLAVRRASPGQEGRAIGRFFLQVILFCQPGW